MPESVTQIRVFLASPGDVDQERKCFPEVIKRLNHGIAAQHRMNLESVMWETHAWPGFGSDPQKVINEQVGDYDIFVGVLWNRIGTPTANAISGTVEEFKKAYDLWKKKDWPKLYFYFNQAPASLDTQEQLDQKGKVIQFKSMLKELGGLYWEYAGAESFKDSLFDHLTKEIPRIADSINKDRGNPDQPGATYAFREISPENAELLSVPNLQSAYSSFQPTEDAPFLRMRIKTSVGYIRNEESGEDEEIENDIYVIRDPIRPYMIQIGETRNKRKKANPEAVPELTSLDINELKSMFPFIQNEKYRWLRMVFAELATNQEVLEYLGKNDSDREVRKIVANNPSAPRQLQQKQCLFCNPKFRELRRIEKASSQKTVMFRNDFPYGPYFHYIAMPSDPIHSWEEIQEEHMMDMNRQIWKFLKKENEANRLGSAGIHIGLNSTIRHLVMGRRIRASAGASIAHVHKQIWGMAPASVNIGDYLSSICTAYRETKPSLDYLGSYLGALRPAGHVIWEDDHAVLYVPIGQISKHELQVMVKRETHNFLDLNEEELESVSKAEFLTTQIYKKIGITSFNEITITEPFHRKTKGFRLIMAFITREVDLAVSELNHLFVVDKHPSDTICNIQQLTDLKIGKAGACVSTAKKRRIPS